MFTGIIEEIGIVIAASPQKLVIGAYGVLRGMELGESIAVNGVCLTVTGFDTKSFSVDIMPETRQRSNLGFLRASDRVNLERALTLDKRLGGHLVQGHVDATGRVSSLNWDGTTNVIEVHVNRLRGKLDKGRNQSYITTVRGRGYALAAT